MLWSECGCENLSKHNLWIDAGIMPSHIGFESAIGKDCATLTWSILADNSPYYEAGVKIDITQKRKWYLRHVFKRLATHPENWWQPNSGAQVTYKPSAKTTLNWSTYVGNEQPDNVKNGVISIILRTI
jgi:hypothetical protein